MSRDTRPPLDVARCGVEVGPHWNPGVCVRPKGHDGRHDDIVDLAAAYQPTGPDDLAGLLAEHPRHGESIVGDGHIVESWTPASDECVTCRAIALAERLATEVGHLQVGGDSWTSTAANASTATATDRRDSGAASTSAPSAAGDDTARRSDPLTSSGVTLTGARSSEVDGLRERLARDLASFLDVVPTEDLAIIRKALDVVTRAYPGGALTGDTGPKVEPEPWTHPRLGVIALRERSKLPPPPADPRLKDRSGPA